MKRFDELDMQQFRGAVVLLDVNGTLLASSEGVACQSVQEAVARLKEVAVPYIFSNGSNLERRARIAALLGVPLIHARSKKPDPRILREIKKEGKPVFVVGDKMLTDGLLAYLAGARFVRVARFRGPGDSFFARVLYLLDDSIAWCMKH